MTECIGFVECGCKRCRQTRILATASHPRHVREYPVGTYTPRVTDPYCGVCRTNH